MCSGRPPKLSKENLQFMHVWDLIGNSFYYASTMESTFPTSLNWTNVESIFRVFKIKTNRMLIKKIKLAERLTIKQAMESIKKG